MNILVINGPNLNMLGIREPSVYGTSTYAELVSFIEEYSTTNNVNVEIYQSNHEGFIIDKLHEAYYKNVDAIIINPGAYTHYSYAIRDAISSICIPTVEVHLSDIRKRENWRQGSVISDVCVKSFMGEHFKSYQNALDYLINLERENNAK